MEASETRPISDPLDPPGGSTAPVGTHEPSGVVHPAEPVTVLTGLRYLEDTAAPDREPSSLRAALRPLAGGRHLRGAGTGTIPTQEPVDLAIASTFMHAAPFQPIRRRNRGGPAARWYILPQDLRRYRRAPHPDRLLTIVLDHTCLARCAWEDALHPHLHWAYTERATICLVSVGVAGSPFRAERLVVRNLLAPQLVPAFSARPGPATPLAHGLELALQTMRHGMQHGNASIGEGRFVLLSDGRGNLPLSSAATAEVSPPVGRRGVEDALRIARAIGQLKRIDPFVVAPPLEELIDLPRRFAEALGGSLSEAAARDREGR